MALFPLTLIGDAREAATSVHGKRGSLTAVPAPD
jgi:hypothetical protein